MSKPSRTTYMSKAAVAEMSLINGHSVNASGVTITTTLMLKDYVSVVNGQCSRKCIYIRDVDKKVYGSCIFVPYNTVEDKPEDWIVDPKPLYINGKTLQLVIMTASKKDNVKNIATVVRILCDEYNIENCTQ